MSIRGKNKNHTSEIVSCVDVERGPDGGGGNDENGKVFSPRRATGSSQDHDGIITGWAREAGSKRWRSAPWVIAERALASGFRVSA